MSLLPLAKGFAQANSGTRSNVLTPLLWLIGILVGGGILFARWTQWDGLLLAVGANPMSFWIGVALAVGITVAILVFLVAFLILVVKNPELLRSESFAIQKMAMERGLVGDNSRGLSDPNAPVATLEPPRADQAAKESDA